MGDYSSYEEDFTEITLSNSTEDESPKKDVKKDDNPFEILSMENILQDVSEIVAKVQSFLEVSPKLRMFFLEFYMKNKVSNCNKLQCIVPHIAFCATIYESTTETNRE